MKVTIEFDTDNAAFENVFGHAVIQVLLKAKGIIIDTQNCQPAYRSLFDVNGNKIGFVEVTTI